MTKAETIKIMAVLGAFYSGSRNDAKMQAEAWYLVLGKYDYETTQKAVLNFAENDVREYATFPTVGAIVKAIKEQQARNERPVREVVRGISYGKGYDDLSTEAKRLISRDKYSAWLHVDAEEFAGRADDFADELRAGTLMLPNERRTYELQ